MRDVLVVYGSGTGCTASVAERIGKTLAARGVGVDVVSVDSDPRPGGYGAVVAGCGARAGNWYGPAKKWVLRNASALRRKPLALFTVGIALADGPHNTEEMLHYTDSLLAKSGVEPVDLGVFAGWYEPERFSFVERIALKMHHAPEGDFRDWGAIEDWAAALAPKLAA